MRKFTFTLPFFTVPSRCTNSIQKKIITLTLLVTLFYATGYAQSTKIDPAFQALLNEPTASGRRAMASMSPVYSITPVQVSKGAGLPLEERYSCIIYTTDIAALAAKNIYVGTILPKFVTAYATLEQLQELAALESIQYIAAPTIEQLHNDIAVAASGASLLQQGRLNNTVYKGKGVIVAIYDTGIDWAHPDFRNPTDNTQSRILRIWDQTLTKTGSEVNPSGFAYGVEYTQAQINDEIDGTPAGFVRESDINGHGTHVAGTAAGNGMAIPLTRKYTGMAPEADIVVIKGGNGSFSSANIIDGLTYLKNLATSLGKPIVVNMSLGGQSGAHDGTQAQEIAVDNFTASAAGRVVCISAGNDNGTNLHNQFSLTTAASNTVQFTVPASSTSGTAFYYRVYVDDNSSVSATATAPDAGTVTATAGASNNVNVLSGTFKITLTNSIDPANGDRYVDMAVTRNSGTTSPAGTWSLAITNNTASTINLHGWLYSTTSDISGTVLVGGNSDYLVGSPGNANTAVTVAAYVGRPSWYSYPGGGGYYSTTARMDDIATFSSHGPRRDGVQKPEITAVGQHVISALSSATSQTASSIVIAGKYFKNQGTSMSCPVVAGAVALMLQANPSQTVTQVRTALFNTATSDALTGTVPNYIWGYGKLDVYKAAASLFNCSPTQRVTYQYDASNLQTGDATTPTYSSDRVAVRFTPGITGKLDGAYYHTHLNKTSLIMEVRADNAGVPGTLLGTLSLPDTMTALYSWNYADLSGLNISITSGSDYYIVLYRDPSSSASWTLRGEATSVDNRSLLSTNGGTSWTIQTFDYKIRSVVYSNPQQTGNVATANATVSRDISTSNLLIDNSCQIVAQLTPAGASPASGTVNASVWVESGVPTYGGQPFVARHYEITPASNASTSTGRVTLYFTQQEFTDFNAAPNSTLDLPTGSGDALGIANLRVAKYPGTSSDNSGMPGTYTGTVTIIDPADADIVWNSTASRWEVSFDVTGFSGFIVQTNATALPLSVESFSGYPSGVTNVLNWKINCQGGAATFYVERSANGTDYTTIGSATAANGCDQPFSYTDKQPLPGKDYYRIKIVESNGAVHYTKFILLQTGQVLVTSLYPTVLTKGQSVQVVLAQADGILYITDAIGRQVLTKGLMTGVQTVTLSSATSGVYFYSIKNSTGTLANGKLVVQ